MLPPISTLSPLLLFLLLGAPSLAGQPAGDLPTYRFKVGQEVSYRGSDDFKYQGDQLRTSVTWHLWVVRANSDGGWRLIFRRGTTVSRTSGNQTKPGKENVTIAYGDVFPDGRIADNDSLGMQMRPESILPRLPRDPAERSNGWLEHNRRTEETQRYHIAAKQPGADRFVFDSVLESPLTAIYGGSSKATFTLDVPRGLVEQVQTWQNYGNDGQGNGTLTLESVQTQPLAWCEVFAQEADRFFAARADYIRALEQRPRTVAAMKAILAQAADRLQAERQRLRSPEFQQQIDLLLTWHAGIAARSIKDVEERSALLDKPAADWSLNDLEGRRHALKNYRGNVVVLDFWYRGCGSCTRSIPQLKQLAAHFQGRPVVLLGMNTDSKEANAKFVVEKLGLNYPNLKAAGVPEKYKVVTYPTVCIIDQDGVLRDIHTDYSPTLRDDVIQIVDKLLQSRSAK